MGHAVSLGFALFVFLVYMYRDCCAALPHCVMALSAVCDFGISSSYSLTIFVLLQLKVQQSHSLNICEIFISYVTSNSWTEIGNRCHLI